MGAVSSREALIDRLPRTMAASMNKQLARADLLFPVERRLLDGRLDWLESLDPTEFDKLFSSLMAVESRMQLPAWSKGEARFSIEDTAIIARSPLYPQWRRELERAFAAIDEGTEKLHPAVAVPRLLIALLPAGLPATPEPWHDPPPDAVRVSLEQPFGDMRGDLLAAIASRPCPAGLTPIESLWVVACESDRYLGLASATVVGWDDTAKLRRKFLDRLNDVHRTLHSVDETMAELERLNLSALLPARLTADTRLREFIRSLLLTGNGSLVLNNSFVQWCASEALRRAQPQVMVASFGIRDKPKPFSSLAWFEDQTRANPAPDRPDAAGSLVDDELLSRYVYFTARRLAPYAGRTLVWFVVEDRKSALVVAPKPGLVQSGRALSARAVRDICVKWLS